MVHYFLQELVGIQGPERMIVSCLYCLAREAKWYILPLSWILVVLPLSVQRVSCRSIGGRRANVLLRTMGQQKVVPTYTLTGLEVSGLNSECYYQLPVVLTQRKMPVTSDNIITQQDLARWSYLSAIQIPSITLTCWLVATLPSY